MNDTDHSTTINLCFPTRLQRAAISFMQKVQH